MKLLPLFVIAANAATHVSGAYMGCRFRGNDNHLSTTGTVIPAKAGIHVGRWKMGCRLRGNDNES